MSFIATVIGCFLVVLVTFVIDPTALSAVSLASGIVIAIALLLVVNKNEVNE